MRPFSQLPPRPPRLGAMLLEQPLAEPHNLSPVLSQRVYRLGISTSAVQLQPRHCHPCGLPAQSGVVGHTQAEAESIDNGTIRPSVCRNSKRKTMRRISAVRIANGEYHD